MNKVMYISLQEDIHSNVTIVDNVPLIQQYYRQEAIPQYYPRDEEQPHPMYMVINKYTIPSSDDDRILIPKNRVPTEPIPEKPVSS